MSELETFTLFGTFTLFCTNIRPPRISITYLSFPEKVPLCNTFWAKRCYRNRAIASDFRNLENHLKTQEYLQNQNTHKSSRIKGCTKFNLGCLIFDKLLLNRYMNNIANVYKLSST